MLGFWNKFDQNDRTGLHNSGQKERVDSANHLGAKVEHYGRRHWLAQEDY